MGIAQETARRFVRLLLRLTLTRPKQRIVTSCDRETNENVSKRRTSVFGQQINGRK